MFAGGALLLSAQGASAATSPTDQFMAGTIFAKPASVVAQVLPSIDQIVCSDATCARGLLPSPVRIESTRYFSAKVAAGGSFVSVPGYVAKLNTSWAYVGDDGHGLVTQMLVQFLPGTSIDAVVAGRAQSDGVTLTGPTEVSGLPTWSGTLTQTDGVIVSYAYSAFGSNLVFTRCMMTSSLAPTGACNAQRAAEIGAATATTTVPSTLRMSPAAQALIPPMPKGLTGVMISEERSVDFWPPELEKAVRGTRSIDMQYLVKAAPRLFVQVSIVPVESRETRAWARRACEPSSDLLCTSTRIPGAGLGWTATQADAAAPTAVLGSRLAWTGGGVTVSGLCSHTDFDAMTPAEVKTCTASLTKVLEAVRGR